MPSSRTAAGAAGGGTLGLLIPPSLSLLTFGAFPEALIGQLCLAGVVPGILAALGFSLWIIAAALRNPAMAPAEPRVSLGTALLALAQTWPLLALIRGAGLAGHSRGRFGHGLGAGLGGEEWPFISATTDRVAWPGMVLAFAWPFYATGLGGFIIEDMVLITGSGTETPNRLPLDPV